MTCQEIKKRIIDTIEENKQAIIAIGEKVLSNPEIGYCEEKTSSLVREIFDELGISYEYPLAITGVKAKLSENGEGPNVCIIGEMDALICAGNAYANAENIAHACGHHAQIAAMLGVAIGLVRSNVMRELNGNVTLMAVPAEEFIDLDFRKKLIQEGKIHYCGGKQELIARGVFNDIDIAMMIHAQSNEEKPKLYVRGNNLGFMAKTIQFHGKAVHGSTPFDGVNALNAAALAILGMHSNRETFREEEKIRIHPIITKGGDVVNSVPDEVIIDTYVRGRTIDAIKKGNRVVERASKGAAEMIGTEVSFENMSGYLPLNESLELSEIMERNAVELLGEKNLVYGEEITGSSDIGDLSNIMPVIQPSIGGFTGILHSKEFQVIDKETAYVLPAKLLALTVAELLYGNARQAKKVINEFVPQMTRDAYISYLNNEGYE